MSGARLTKTKGDLRLFPLYHIGRYCAVCSAANHSEIGSGSQSKTENSRSESSRYQATSGKTSKIMSVMAQHFCILKLHMRARSHTTVNVEASGRNQNNRKRFCIALNLTKRRRSLQMWEMYLASVHSLDLGLPDAFCKNASHFVNSDRSRLHL